MKEGRKRMRVPGLSLLVCAVFCLAACSSGGGETNGRSEQAVPVVTARVEQRDVPQLLSTVGTVQSLHTVTLKPQVSGIVTEVLFEEGQFVKRGALLARIDDRAILAGLQQARAEKARSEAQLKAAEADLERYRIADQAISRQALEQQSAQVEQLKAAVGASEAAIAAQEVQLSYTRIVAPIAGRVGLRRIDSGNLVQAGDGTGLVSIAQVDPISVVFALPQEALPRIQPFLNGPSQAAAAPATAYDRDEGKILAEGRLSVIDNQIDAASGSIRLRAEFDNPGGALWPGQFVALRLRTGMSAGAAVVPRRAVQQGMQGPFVFKVIQGKAQVVPVRVGYQDDDSSVILGGLSPGDTVVIDGQSRLKPGSPVKPVQGTAG